MSISVRNTLVGKISYSEEHRMKKVVIFLSLFALPLTSWSAEDQVAPAHYWSQWRGPQGTGVAPHGNPPIEWSEDKNVRWKITIPGQGHASPIVWEDRVYVLTAIPVEVAAATEGGQGGRRRGKPPVKSQFVMLAIDRQSGEIVWQRTAREEKPHEGIHPDGSWAANSPITDGEHIYAYFGSRGLYCYDMEGELKWQKDLGDMTTRLSFGEGASPALYGDALVVNWDHEGESFIVVLDKRTGAERWRAGRDERTSWSTPLVLEVDGRAQVVVNATNRVRGYDLKNGDVIWECSGMTANAIPSPVAADGVLYVMSGFRGNALLAIRLAGAKGDITGTDAVVWSYDKDTPYVPSPLLYGNTLYFLKHNKGILSGLNTETGEQNYMQRLEDIEGMYASPVGAKDRIYLVGRNGVSLVIKHGAEYEVLSSNVLDESFSASPAIADGELYLRGQSTLYCIAKE